MKTQDLLNQWEQSVDELEVNSGLSAGGWGFKTWGKKTDIERWNDDMQGWESASCTDTWTMSPC